MATSSLINTLPVEVWNHILNEACQDDGTTSRNLLLVSRSWLRLCRNHQFYSVAITSMRMLERFLSALQTAHPSTRRTRFLYVTFQPPMLSLRAAQPLYDVLGIVGRTLEKLTVCFAAPYTRRMELQFPRLPRLEYLGVYFLRGSFVGFSPEFGEDKAPNPGESKERFPGLRTLEVGGKAEFVPMFFWSSFHEDAPHLYEVRAPSNLVYSIADKMPDDVKKRTRLAIPQKTIVEGSLASWRAEVGDGTVNQLKDILEVETGRNVLQGHLAKE